MKDIDQINPLDNLEIFAKQVVEGFITGLHKSPYHGFSVEFAEHRSYNPGESIRHIDWKLFGRTDKLFIKRYEEETNLRCQLILDISSSMYYPNFEKPNLAEPNKLLFSIVASSALINLLKKQRDAVGLSMFADTVRLHTPAKVNTRHHRRLFHELEKVINIDSLKDKLPTLSLSSLNQIAERLHKRSMVMIFTDMIDNSLDLDTLFSAYRHLKYNNHEIILFHLSEPLTEHQFNFENRPYKFVDVESGEEIKLNPAFIKKDYQKASSDRLDELRNKCLQYKIELVEVDINKGFDQILIAYLLKRQKMF